MVWSSRPVGTSRSPDTQAFSIGQDREGRTQGPFGADEHDPAGRMGSGQGGRRFPSCQDSDGNCPRHQGTPGMAVHTREARLCRHQRQRRVPKDGWSGKPILGHPSRAGASRHQKAPSSMFRDKWPERGRCVGRTAGRMAFPSSGHGSAQPSPSSAGRTTVEDPLPWLGPWAPRVH